jgi:prepilin-type N-terminal cleavage/methylation domain-containing protein
MRTLIKRLHGDQRGLSLLELTVVAAILSILAALTAVAVSGTTSTTREVARANDIAEMQKAVDRFANEGTAGEQPTTTSALPDTGGTQGVDYYIVEESVLAVDVNVDGDTSDTLNVLPISWTATDDDSDQFHPAYISKRPKHNGVAVNNINDNGVAENISEAWVIDTAGAVYVLVADSAY